MANPERLEIAELGDHKAALYHCADCSYCVDAVWDERHLEHVCPTLEHHSPALSYSGRGYISLARALVEGEEFPLAEVAKRVFTCTACGNCDRVCPIGLSPMSVNQALRTLLVNQGAAPAGANSIYERLVNNVNALAHAGNPIDSSVGPSLDVVDTLMMPGCTNTEGLSKEIAAYQQVITQIKPNCGTLGAVSGTKAVCCGSAFAELGYQGEAEENFQKMTAQVNIFPRLDQIIHLSPQCRTRCRADNRVIGFVEWLHSQVMAGKTAASQRAELPKIAWISSCHRADGNQLMVELLESLGAPIAGAASMGRYSLCCGAGGGMPEAAPESAAKMALAAVSKAAQQAAPELLIVPDPTCLGHIQHTLAHERQAPIVVGLGEFLATYFNFQSA